MGDHVHEPAFDPLTHGGDSVADLSYLARPASDLSGEGLAEEHDLPVRWLIHLVAATCVLVTPSSSGEFGMGTLSSRFSGSLHEWCWLAFLVMVVECAASP